MADYGEADLISSEAFAEDFLQTRLNFILDFRINLCYTYNQAIPQTKNRATALQKRGFYEHR